MNQLQPLLRKHVCEVTGFGEGQNESGAVVVSGRRHRTVRVCRPEPHVVEQPPNTLLSHEQPVRLVQLCVEAGRVPVQNESSTATLSLRRHVTARLCVPVLHAAAEQTEKAVVFHT